MSRFECHRAIRRPLSRGTEHRSSTPPRVGRRWVTRMVVSVGAWGTVMGTGCGKTAPEVSPPVVSPATPQAEAREPEPLELRLEILAEVTDVITRVVPVSPSTFAVSGQVGSERRTGIYDASARDWVWSETWLEHIAEGSEGLSATATQVVFSGGRPAQFERGDDSGCRGGRLSARDHAGAPQWGWELPHRSCDVVVGPVAHDDEGNVYAVAYYRGALPWPGAPTLESGVLVSWSSDGAHRWFRALPEGFWASAIDVVDQALVLGGNAEAAPDFGHGQGQKAGPYVAVYDIAGQPRWDAFLGNRVDFVQIEDVRDVVLDERGGVAAALPSHRQHAVVHVGHDEGSGGVTDWVYGLPPGVELRALARGPHETYVIGGSFTRSASLGGPTREVAEGKTRGFVVAIGDDGSYVADAVLDAAISEVTDLAPMTEQSMLAGGFYLGDGFEAHGVIIEVAFES